MMNLYCVGGAGCNIGRMLAKHNGSPADGFAEIKTIFVDSSDSNLRDGSVARDQVYLVEGLDGSGKVRSSNYTHFREAAKEILHTFKPESVNVIITSAGGGSGSVIGPILTSEMLSRGELVINIVIGSTGSKIEIDNTAKTLKSYEQIATAKNQPAVVYYLENSKERPRSDVDSNVISTVALLSAAFSGQNRELDSEDLKNWINYQRVTSYEPRLALLEIFYSDIALAKGTSLISAVTLAQEGGAYSIDHPVDYHTHGFLPAKALDAMGQLKMPIHLCVVAGFFNPVIERLGKLAQEHAAARELYNDKPIISGSERSTDDGLIL